MADYEVYLKVKVTDIEDQNYHFHYDTLDFLLETMALNDAEIVSVKKIV